LFHVNTATMNQPDYEENFEMRRCIMEVKCKNCGKDYDLFTSEFCCKECAEEYFMHT